MSHALHKPAGLTDEQAQDLIRFSNQLANVEGTVKSALSELHRVREILEAYIPTCSPERIEDAMREYTDLQISINAFRMDVKKYVRYK